MVPHLISRPQQKIGRSPMRRLLVEECAKIPARPSLTRSPWTSFRRLKRPEADLLVTWPGGRSTALTVGLLATSQRLGGIRLWFACPSCGRRVGTLYSPSPDQAFACRRCQALVYASQYQNPASRALSRYLKVWGLLKPLAAGAFLVRDEREYHR
jgi:hypothetical protein